MLTRPCCHSQSVIDFDLKRGVAFVISFLQPLNSSHQHGRFTTNSLPARQLFLVFLFLLATVFIHVHTNCQMIVCDFDLALLLGATMQCYDIHEILGKDTIWDSLHGRSTNEN